MTRLQVILPLSAPHIILHLSIIPATWHIVVTIVKPAAWSIPIALLTVEEVLPGIFATTDAKSTCIVHLHPAQAIIQILDIILECIFPRFLWRESAYSLQDAGRQRLPSADSSGGLVKVVQARIAPPGTVVIRVCKSSRPGRRRRRRWRCRLLWYDYDGSLIERLGMMATRNSEVLGPGVTSTPAVTSGVIPPTTIVRSDGGDRC